MAAISGRTAPYSTHISRQHVSRWLSHAIFVMIHLQHTPDESLSVWEGYWRQWRSIWSHGNSNDTHSTILYTYLPTTCISTALSCHIRHYALRTFAGRKLVGLGGRLTSMTFNMVVWLPCAHSRHRTLLISPDNMHLDGSLMPYPSLCS